MQTWVIMASGQSLTTEDIEYVRLAKISEKIQGVIAVSNVGIDYAPWADALVSHDVLWWAHNLHSNMFKGRKFCRSFWSRCEVFIPNPRDGCNSGLMAMQIARDIFKAGRILLLGFDMHGTHYFGPHKKGLTNTKPDKFQKHISQFEGWSGAEVINCTPDSALQIFNKGVLRDII